jgi:DHA1 family multidrug resistance protein-like MFS transporter
MVERALLSFVIVMASLSFVTEPWQVVALRTLQGFFAGYGALTITMAADSVPPHQMASAIGTVQIAHRLGPGFGPAIGGTIAPLVGLRLAFLVSAGFYVIALALVVFLYRERHTRFERRRQAVPEGRVTFRNVLALQNFVLLMGVLFGVQLVDRSLGPILPLFVGSIGVSERNVAQVSGILFSVLASATAIGHWLCDRLLRIASPRAVISGAAAAGAFAAVGFSISQGVLMLGICGLLFGGAIGAAMTATYTAAGTLTPKTAHGTGFGLLTSASLAGLALSPVVSGLIAARSIRAVYLLDSVVLVGVAILVSRIMIETPARTETPLVEEG